jgi:hypothetical protein
VTITQPYSAYAALAAQPAREVLVDPETVELEPWLHVGDPLAETAIKALQAHKLIRRNLIPGIRELASEGNQACIDFLGDVETPPSWADFDAMRAGGVMGQRNPLPLILGMHGTLPMTYADGFASPVLVGTGRLAGDLPRRLFETATLFLGVLDTDEMRPGRSEWERCVRIRLMHTMVRVKTLQSGKWDLSFCQPVNQLSTAAGPYIFGEHRVRILREFGARISDEEADSFYLMWRYVTRVMGTVPELLCRTADEQRILDRRIMSVLYTPNDDSRALTQALLDGLTGVRQLPPFPRAVHEAIARRVLSPPVVGPAVKGDVANDLEIPRHPVLDRALSVLAHALRLYGFAHCIPLLARQSQRLGRLALHRLLESGLAGVPADYQA